MEPITFKGVVDRYNGITVDSQEEPCNSNQFLTRLTGNCVMPLLLVGMDSHMLDIKFKFTDSLQKWAEDKKRCVWFKVHIKDAAWVPVLAKEGFNFHHSRGEFVMMYKWLPTDSSANLPPASHTNLGVGGLVMNDKNQMLVVVEKHTEVPHWKLPGGYVERGEDIKDAAVREIKEETGVDAVFESLVTFRHAHNMGFGNSDLYFVVLLRATSNVISKSDTEIQECQWMDIDEYLNNPQVLEYNRFIVNQALNLKDRNLNFNLKKTTVQVGKWSRVITSFTVED